MDATQAGMRTARPVAGRARPTPYEAEGAGLPRTCSPPIRSASSPAGWPTRPAAPIAQPNAMVLATVSAPASRGPGRCCSRATTRPASCSTPTGPPARASDLAGQPRACLLFPWHAMHRQVIIEGGVTRADPGRERAVLPGPAARLPARRVGEQAVLGAGVAGRARRAVRRAGAPLAGRDETVPMPDFWGGYVVAPDVDGVLAGPARTGCTTGSGTAAVTGRMGDRAAAGLAP